MFGVGENYDYLNDTFVNFPEKIKVEEAVKYFKNEREFVEFLIRNDWIQRQIGIKITGQVTGLFPDIKGEIYDKKGGAIRVEAEYRAENYNTHKHPWGGCNLILSFIRRKGTRIMRGCPVWSFYYSSGGELSFCLYDDIYFDFKRYQKGIFG